MKLTLIKFKNELFFANYIDKKNVFQLIEGDIYSDKIRLTNCFISKKDVKILFPYKPTKIIALGYNYKDLVGEKTKYDEPIIFLKPTTALISDGDYILIPENYIVWSEVELAIIIKKEAKNIKAHQAKDFILGYAVANDVTMENILNRDHHLVRSKGLDTFCPISNYIITDVNTNNLTLINMINNKVYQYSSTKNRILNDYQIIELLSKFFTLLPGDIILTGTPANAQNAIIKNNDTIFMEIKKIGTLKNKVKTIGLL
ncbi:MAG: fumarylacetoacetate hydrolase family protein [Candidatus Woesearchaeota archaeon]